MLHEHSDEDVMNQYTMGLVFLYLLNHLENLSHNSSMDYREAIVQAVLGYIKSDCKSESDEDRKRYPSVGLGVKQADPAENRIYIQGAFAAAEI